MKFSTTLASFLAGLATATRYDPYSDPDMAKMDRRVLDEDNYRNGMQALSTASFLYKRYALILYLQRVVFPGDIAPDTENNALIEQLHNNNEKRAEEAQKNMEIATEKLNTSFPEEFTRKLMSMTKQEEEKFKGFITYDLEENLRTLDHLETAIGTMVRMQSH
ncbi:hypothetical protein CDD83_4442 [Cordyceps sp. RAO-2017]|nr:hypothetical protein CDD83_4442 [Cordyceps sp. RAO-2017]